jgi:hypothetical protein
MKTEKVKKLKERIVAFYILYLTAKWEKIYEDNLLKAVRNSKR